MIEDGILQDDLVILEKLTEASLAAGAVKNGQTVAALLNGEATLKRFYKKNLKQISKNSARDELMEDQASNSRVIAELHPANPNYSVIPVKSDDRFEIQGIMLGLFRRY